MRSVFFVIVATLLASCATTSGTNLTRTYDHKYNTYSYAAKAPANEFVGTSVKGPDKAKPNWYRWGHP